MASCVDEISPLVAPLCTRFRSRIQNSLIYDRNVFSIPVVAQAVNKPNRSPLAMLGSTTQPTPWAKFIKTNWFSPINPLKQIVKNPFNKGTGIIPKEHWRELIFFCNWQPPLHVHGQCLVLVPTTLRKQETDHRSTKHSYIFSLRLRFTVHFAFSASHYDCDYTNFQHVFLFPLILGEVPH